jgi:hypothetical protein
MRYYKPNGPVPVEALYDADKDRDRIDIIYDWLGDGIEVEELDFVLAPVADKPEQTFVEVENMAGEGVRLGEYVLRDDGFHAIRFFGVLRAAEGER